MTFPKNKDKNQTFITEWKKSFLRKKKKKKEEEIKWRKETKTIKVRIKIFQKNKRERNSKAVNCQKLIYAN